MPNTLAKIVMNDIGGIVAEGGGVVHRENAQRRTSNAQLRSRKDRAANSIDHPRKRSAQSGLGDVIEDLRVRMTIAIAKIDIMDLTASPARTSRCRRLRSDSCPGRPRSRTWSNKSSPARWPIRCSRSRDYFWKKRRVTM